MRGVETRKRAEHPEKAVVREEESSKLAVRMRMFWFRKRSNLEDEVSEVV